MDQNENKSLSVQFDFGSFEGFNFRSQSAIFGRLSSEDILTWDHDAQGEAEFWPAGDRPEVRLIFRNQSTVTGSELLDLDRILEELGGDSTENFLLVYYAVTVCGDKLEDLTADRVQDYGVQIFVGQRFIDVRRDAAYELLELYYPDEHRIVNESTCDGLVFDVDRFLDSPGFSTEEVQIGDEKYLLVAPQ